MTIANINIGTSPNDGTGDTLRHGFQIVNNNFSYVSSILTGNITTTNFTANGNITAANFIGNGAGLTGLSATLPGSNITLISSNIYGANSNDGRGTVVSIIPNVAQAPNGQFLTINASTYPNIAVNSGNASIATLILGQSNHGVILSPTTGSGNITISPYGGGTFINGALIADTINSRGNIGSLGNLNLIGVQGTQYTIAGNVFEANTSTTINVAMQPVFARTRVLTANANIALNFVESTYPIVKGTERVVYIRNTSGGNITVSNIPSYNNKGATTATISSSTVSQFIFLATDTTFGNIIATVINN